MESKQHKVDPVKSGEYFEISPRAIWMSAAIILAIGLLVSLFFNFRGVSAGPSVSGEVASQKAIEFINSNPQLAGQVSLVSVKQSGQFYEATVSYQGQQVPVFVTLDGKYLLNGAPIDLESTQTDNTNNNANTGEQQQTATEIPKTDKPKVELFVMSHCPFGTQVEKGMLPVVALLKDKIDFDVKFVYYAMHGEEEVYEQLNQYCIQKEQSDKYMPYLECFLEAGDGEGCLTEEKIDKAKLKMCTDKADKEFKITDNFKNQATWLSGRFPLFDIHKADNEKYGVRGSPTLIINGVEAQSGRDSPSLLRTVCGAFNEAPEECSTELEAGTPAPGFGWDTTSATNLANCGGF